MPNLERNPERRDLTAFLISRRARLAPPDVGLVAGARRRTPGLRREEVAQLLAKEASVSSADQGGGKRSAPTAVAAMQHTIEIVTGRRCIHQFGIFAVRSRGQE